MRHHFCLLDILACLCLAAVAPLAIADDNGALSRQQLIDKYPELAPENITDSALPDFFEINLRGSIFYVSKNGKYMLRGDLTDLDSHRNLSEARRSDYRAKLLARVDPKSEIVFSPKNGEVRHRVIVFTDVDCGYCRALHRQIDAITARGIEVHYVSYPRTGPNTESWTKAEHVWCASDRKAALTQAKLGGEISPNPTCKTTPIATHYALGQTLGMTGTPAIYADTGEDVGGYSEPDVLSARLDSIAAAH